MRYFSEEDLEWVYWVNFFRYTQMGIEEIKQYYAFYLVGDSKLKERREIVIKHQNKIAKDIKKFQKIYEKLENKLKICERDPELDFKPKKR